MPICPSFVENTEKEAIEILQRAFNFNRYQARAYVAVLKGACRPKEIARTAKIPVTRVYDILTSLSEDGLVQKTGQGYVALEPLHAFTNLLQQERTKLENAFEEKKRSVNNVLPLLHKLRKKRIDATDAAILRGLPPLVVKLLEIVSSSNEFVFAVRKAAKLKEEFKRVVGRFSGKKFVFILHPSVEVSEEDWSFFKGISATVFTSHAVLLDVLVSDGGEALIGLPLDDEPVVVWVKDFGFSSSLLRSLLELADGYGGGGGGGGGNLPS